MSTFLRQYKIQLIVGLFTLFILVSLPSFLSQFAVISFVSYLGLSALLVYMVRKYKTSQIFVYVSHLFAFLIAYSFFVYIWYGFAHLSGFTMFL
jgi:hypothetical protein